MTNYVSEGWVVGLLSVGGGDGGWTDEFWVMHKMLRPQMKE